MDLDKLRDPLSMDLRQQWQDLARFIRGLSLHEVGSTEQQVDILARLLHDPRYTLLISQKFRPILFILCARWLDQHGDEDAKLVAFALLIHTHEELFPILATFIRNCHFSKNPLESNTSPTSMSLLYSRLLAYYRILVACPHSPVLFQWPSGPLSQLLSIPDLDNGIRWLSVRCFALHTHMSEAQREELQLSVLGPPGEVDAAIEFGCSLEGETQWVDGWLLPVLEVVRIREAREVILDSRDFLSVDDPSFRINLDKLTHRVADVHGILMLRDSGHVITPTELISTPSTVDTLRALAIRVSLRLPTLLSSPPSSGKSLILQHLASLLHPASQHQLITIQLSDTSLDARSLLGSYISSTRNPGTFEWQEGVIVQAMRHGLWLVLEDIDRASSEVLGTLIPLIDSLNVHKHIGAPASIDVPGRGRIEASETFTIFATRSVRADQDGSVSAPTFLGFHKFSRVDVPAPTEDDLATIIHGKFSKFGRRTTRAIIRSWATAKTIRSAPGLREIGIHELETWCRRIESLLLSDADVSMEANNDATFEELYPDLGLREEMYLEARDVFFGAGAFSVSARAQTADVALVFARHLSLSRERTQWVVEGRLPELQIEKDSDGHTTAVKIGKTRLQSGRNITDSSHLPQRPFAMHRSALLLTERIATSVSLAEPVLLVGETGTGKTTLVSHIASLVHRHLVSLNLSQQTESSDLLGGFKPVDTRVSAGELHRRFINIFARTFSRRKNDKFEDAVRKAVNEGKWKRVVTLWKECTRLALIKINERNVSSQEHNGTPREGFAFNDGTPRKRRKFEEESGGVREAEWLAFERDVEVFDVQHVRDQGKFSFAFVEGPLVRALRHGYWVLLDEINLANPETLQCITSILRGPTASVVLTEQGSFTPVPRHPDFRLFACMNPATDVGKKDLPVNIRSHFTEIHVSSPDADRETLLAIVHQYIGHCALADRSALLDVAEFYVEVKKLAENRDLADGSNHRPHFSMRTLARALTFTSDTVLTFGLRRALWEGCLMAFSMALDEKSGTLVRRLAEKHLLASVKNVPAMIAQIPAAPPGDQVERFERIGPFWVERGNLEPDSTSDYILTPSVQSKIMDLARVVLTRRFPVLLEGPTSSGKTSAIEYLARRTGHRFVRVNNHEHTDIQEYLGTYISDPNSGKLIFQDGILVRALRNGDWIVLDELNLAPTDVLEALNRLLDDNRELFIPETHEVVKPHPHFMLFATQNPPGLYAGRKILSRAFRNRFLEVHFDDVPQSELQTIISEKCRIPESYAQRIVAVFRELSQRRQVGRVFESKHGFATLRDLFRWAGREASSTQQLAQNGYMLLAERARRPDDKEIVKEVIESIMKERIDPGALYQLQDPTAGFANFNLHLPVSSDVIWTFSMRRLFMLVATALRYNEPVLLVGATGSGKTSVCQLYANAMRKHLVTLNCHQGTETADLIGSQRPLRNRSSSQAQLLHETQEILQAIPNFSDTGHAIQDVNGMLALLKEGLNLSTLSPTTAASLRDYQHALQQSKGLFEWHDGPLVRAMRTGDVFLLDEISLADDSVLERLNSVLEPARNIVLAERGGLDVEHARLTAHPEFKLLATMNPGGDYGKKELSPALRNRFTEIWVPAVETQLDLRMIIEKSWRHENLLVFTDRILIFTDWLASAVGVTSSASLRDILAFINFANKVVDSHISLPASAAFHHAAHMIFLDGLETSSHTASWSIRAVNDLRERARNRLEQLVPLGESHTQAFDTTFLSSPKSISTGPFSIPKGHLDTPVSAFSLEAPTTRDNFRRLMRACQLSNPILLEGSPGVGKTSLVVALGGIAGHRVCRVNLSDQTDLVDLFGSDLPVEGGRAGEFVWKDATFLRAMQDGDWVLLDEMNLAPQAVLEGLNAVLDHRGTVFIPELGRTFTKHPRFRIFAAQNPLHQGGGRKGLPKSFLDRFTKVHIHALAHDDLMTISQNMFPSLSVDHLRSMIHFNFRLHDEIMVKRSFGKDGSPWEFNLRDITRWATLLVAGSDLPSPSHPSIYLDALYLQRFRTEADRIRVMEIFCDVFELPLSTDLMYDALLTSATRHHVQFGSSLIARRDHSSLDDSVELQMHLRPLAAASICIQNGWLMILSGDSGTGKTQLARYLSSKAGCRLQELSLSSGVDTADILGSFEQMSDHREDVGRFEWVDGPLIQAMKRGHWIVLENANLCNPSVLDRLNSLCEPNGFLALTERGHVNGELVILKPDPHFRLLLTVDPRNGDLSRAMRNRAVEIHLLLAPLAPQDSIRLLDSMRVPILSPSVDKSPDLHAVQYELVRRATFCYMTDGSLRSRAAIRSGLLNHDSTASYILDYVILQQVQCHGYPLSHACGRTQLFVRMLVPSMIAIFRRLSTASENIRLIYGTQASELKAMFEKLNDHPILILRHALGEALAQSRGIPPLFIAAQPIDFFMSPKLLAHDEYGEHNLASKQRLLSTAIGLFVRVHFSYHAETTQVSDTSSIFHLSRLYYGDQNMSLEIVPGASSMYPLYMSTISFAQSILQALTFDNCEKQLLLLQLVQNLVYFAEHLRESTSGLHFDFTSARVISGWFLDYLVKDEILLASPVYLHAESLSNEVSLASGHGMQQIWRNFVFPNLPEDVRITLTRLDSLAVCMNPLTSTHDKVREDIVNTLSLMSIDLPFVRNEQDAVLSLCRELEHRILSNEMLLTEDIASQFPPILAIAELDFLSAAMSGETYQMVFRRGKYLIELTAQTAFASLAHLTRVQHHLWVLDAHTHHDLWQPARLVSMVQRWISAVNDSWIDRSCIIDRHSVGILTPVLLNDILEKCLHNQPLQSLELHKKTLRLLGTFVANQCQENSLDRLDQILRLWTGVLVMLATCFEETFPPETMQKIRKAAHDGQCNELTGHLLASTNLHLSRTVRDLLIPASRTLDSSYQVEREQTRPLGKAWVDLGLALIRLYVPDIPLDPVVMHICITNFWRNREDEILALIGVHESVEMTITGSSSNPFLAMLRIQIREVQTKLQDMGHIPTSRDVDLASLHALFGEITPFLSKVIYSTKFNKLLSDLEAGHNDSQSHATALQDTISGFMTRLESGYVHFTDIIQPMFLALSALKFGLYLLSHAARNRSANPHVVDRLRTLVEFPTAAAIETSMADTPAEAALSRQLLFNLVASAYDIGFHNTRPESYIRVDSIYSKFTDIWMEDLRKQERDISDAQSLYRHKAMDNNMLSETDADEEEFYNIFPTFEDGDSEERRAEKSDSRSSTATSPVMRLSTGDMERISRLHVWITSGQHSGDHLNVLDIDYHELRTTFVRDILATHLDTLPHVLDTESLPYQLLILSKESEELVCDRSMQQVNYSFYHDSNVPEVRKALVVVQAIQQRLVRLMKDWPDQMVLHHLVARCDAVLKLNIRSSLARVLTALEQLILQTEDWEIYSNRDNTLKPQQAALSEIIVNWRRLELSCWPHLLELQSLAFSTGTAEWWFRLYELTIRGTLAAAVDCKSSTHTYFVAMIPLVEQFIATGPLGQFAARLQLLRSFGMYSHKLSHGKTGSESDALARASRIIQNLHSFYNQFSQSVSCFLADRRTTIEKELMDYIKLASWKDVNVYALKQSAQRTHRQLYKCVRKYRELLREPVAPILSDTASDTTLLPPQPSSWSKPAFACQNTRTIQFPINLPSNGTTPYHMRDLTLTLAKFKHLLKTHGEPIINSVSYGYIDDFAGNIAQTVITLSSETNDAVNNMRMQKTLMMRKRKAWIDLLRELKRAGFSSRLKPDILDRQRDKVWLLDRPSVTYAQDGPFYHIASKGEDYLNRMLLLLPELRRSLSSHHGDLTTRELQRAANFVESSFDFALGARARFTKEYLEYEKLDRIVRRLTSVSATEGAVVDAPNISMWLELCCKIEHSLEEVFGGCQRYNTLGGTTPLSQEVLKALMMHLDAIRHSRHSLTTLQDAFGSTHKGLIVTEEYNDLEVARTCILSTTTTLRRWMDTEPRIRHLCDPVLFWLLRSPLVVESSPANDPQMEGTPQKAVIERLLLIVQNVLTLCQSLRPHDLNQPPDNYASDCQSLSDNMSRVFAIDAVGQAIKSFIDLLVLSPVAGRLGMIQTILPFVDGYLQLVKHHLIIQAQLVRSFFKFSHVLCCVILSLIQKGFCKPPDMDSDHQSQAGEKEIQNGTGLGQGTGSENISNQIEDKSQVEGLQDEVNTEEHPEGAADDSGIEMDDDFEGDTQDLNQEGNESSSDDNSQPGIDEQVGNLDTADSEAVDEKIWGNENIQGENVDGHTSKASPANEVSEVVAKENHENRQMEKQNDVKPLSTDDTDEELANLNSEGTPDEQSVDAGKQMDEFVPEAHTLDLPDNLDFGKVDDGPEDKLDLQDDDMGENDSQEHLLDNSPDDEPTLEESDKLAEPPASLSPEAPHGDHEDDLHMPSPVDEDRQSEPSVSRPDLVGDGQTNESNVQEMRQSSSDDPNQETPGVKNNVSTKSGDEHVAFNEALPEDDNSTPPSVTTGVKDTGGHDTSSATPVKLTVESTSFPNPLRSLGDTLKEVHRRLDQIGDAPESESLPASTFDDISPPQMEYLHEGMVDDHGLQALGPARKDQVAKLSDLQFNDKSSASDSPDILDSYDSSLEACVDRADNTLPTADTDVGANPVTGDIDIQGALTYDQVKAGHPDHPYQHNNQLRMESLNPADDNVTDDVRPLHDVISDEQSVELVMKRWQETGRSDAGAGELWHLYDSLTQELSSALCEQLRLILEPTLATRLRGDYRTGKRLNMKKIIPYIASEYTKDKIWLRRTRPSQREYQVLIALDDSRSMAESRSIHLAYQTLALVSKALNRLESGEVAIAQFGEIVELVHGFEDGMVGDREGEKVMRKFKFDQCKTDVRGLVETSLEILRLARERRSMGRGSSEAADLWQLEIIISDGICQGHDDLRTVLRRAEEQRVMIVFIIIDSLHAHHAPSASDAHVGKTIANSILSMNQVSYKDVGGRIELQMDRYLDSFPFQYYVVLRNVEALPDVLSGTLKQFFERISEE